VEVNGATLTLTKQMYNFLPKNTVQPPGCIRKALKIMKITTFIIMAAALHVSAITMAQKITLSVKNAPLVDVFNQINTQTGYDFLFTSTIIRNSKPVTIDAKNEELEEVLNEIFAGQTLDFSIENKSVVISNKDKIESGSLQKATLTLLIGNVADGKGNYLPGVTIRLKDGRNMWTTDKDGKFKILLTDNSGTLQFSFVGFQTREIPVIKMTTPMSVVLKEKVGSLDEIQVLAYGTTTKRLNTGDVVTITAAEIEKHPVSNVLEAVQNQIPGFFVQQQTGNPGGAFATNIRGGNSVLGSGVSPLYIVDGVQYPIGTSLPFQGGLSSNPSTNSASNRGGNLLNYLNPNDIETFSVLKDADATALYGSRGAYGVIIITTKKGKPGAPAFNINVSDDISTAGFLPPLLNTDQYLMIRREAFKNDGATPGATDLDLNGTWSTDSYTDWRKYYLGTTGHNERANFTYQGGSELSTFLISGNVSNQQSLQRGIGGEIDGGFRMDLSSYSKNKKFFLDFSATYNLSRNNTIPIDLTFALTNAPNAPLPVLPDGALNWSTGSNPLAAMNALYLNTNNNLLSNLTLRYNFTKDFTFNTVVGYSLNADKEFRALPTSYFVPSATSYTQTTSTINTFNNTNLTLDPNFEYTHTFLRQLQTDSRIGFTAQMSNNYQLATTGTNFTSDQLLVSPTSASGTITSNYNSSPGRYLGAFIYTRLNWDNKYLLSLNARRDGSTNFGPGNRFGNFGSVAGAWIMSEEPWMKSLNSVLPFVKLRASYGTTGGDNLAAYSYLNTFSITSTPYSGSIGFNPSRIANPDLHWESKRSEEIGTTLQFLNGRIELDASYYQNWTSDPIYPTVVSTVTGFSNVNSNTPGAKLLQWGYESMLTTRNIESHNFTWSSTFNFTSPHSKLLSFPGLDNVNSVSLTQPNLRLGEPTSGVLLYNYAGVNPQTGNYSFINAKGVKGDFNAFNLNNVTDRTQYVDLAPKYYGGMGNTFSYKNLSIDFFIMLTSQMGKKLDAYSSYLPGYFNVNMTTDALSRWQKPGDITNVPKPSQSFISLFTQSIYDSSTGAYTNTTYARLQNVNINYKFAGKWLTNANIRNLSVFLRGENLYTLSKYKDEDPENLNPNSLGPIRVFSAGLNVSL
jgi:TonB-linked SusC/RagA family outer membrane protein